MKIYYKFNLMIIFLLVTLTLIVTASVNVMMNDALEQEMMERELIIAEYVTEDLTNPLLQKDTAEVNEIIDNAMISSADIRYIYVIGFDGIVIAHTFSQGFPADMITANPIPPQEETAVQVLSIEGESIQDVGVRVLDGMDAKVYFGFSRANLITSINNTTSTIVGTAAFVLLLGILMSFILTRTLTDPIEKLVAGTNRVAEGDLDFQVEVTTGDDIGVLADSFNRMISERKIVETNLKLFKNLIDQSNDAIYAINPETYQILEVNEKGCTNLGYEREEIIGMKIFNICMSIPDEVSWEREVEDIKEKGYLIYEGEHRRKDGSTFNVEINIKYISMEDADYLLSVVRDITERKHAEDALKDSEEKYRNIYDNTQVGLYRSRLSDGKMLMVNNRMADMFGYDSPEKAVAEFVTSEHYVIPGTREKLLDILREHGKFNNFEALITKRDGSEIWFQFSGTLVPEKGYFEGVATDVTERKQAEEKIRELNQKLEQRVKDRTAELKDKNVELENMNKLFVGRELRMAELKEQISGLEEKHRGSDSKI